MKKLALSEVKTLQDLLKHYGIGANDWDYLIIGDGSGTTWQEGIGWGSTLICKFDGSRKVFYGAMSAGTNNTAELYVVLHPLSYLANNINWADRPEGIKVHVITDSQYVANGLNKDNPIWVAELNANRELWMGIHMTRRRGIAITGHHLPRNSVGLAELGHELANASRKCLIGVLTDLKKTADTANPIEKPDSREGTETKDVRKGAE
jgi:ribonuclease HI